MLWRWQQRNVTVKYGLLNTLKIHVWTCIFQHEVLRVSNVVSLCCLMQSRILHMAYQEKEWTLSPKKLFQVIIWPCMHWPLCMFTLKRPCNQIKLFKLKSPADASHPELRLSPSVMLLPAGSGRAKTGHLQICQGRAAPLPSPLSALVCVCVCVWGGGEIAPKEALSPSFYPLFLLFILSLGPILLFLSETRNQTVMDVTSRHGCQTRAAPVPHRGTTLCRRPCFYFSERERNRSYF